MVWANAIVLGLGGLLLTLPVIVHFLMQEKPKLHEFPALRFVQKRQLTNKSRMRLRHIVLLILRCLIILLMAAALAGPSVASREFGQWVTLGGVGISALVVALALAMVTFATEKRNGVLVGLLGALLLGHLSYLSWAGLKLMNSESTQLIGDSAAPVSAILLVDNSFRMDYQHQNNSNLDRAREMGRWLIEQFPADSQACVLKTENDVPFFSVDLGAARNQIDNLEVAFATSSIPDRLADGLKLLDEAEHERREIYIITDLSAKSWASTRETIAKELEAAPGLSIFVLDIGQTELTNYSLSPVRLGRESITEDGSLEVSTTMSRLGSSSARKVRFRLERPDKTRPVVRDRKVLVPDRFVERNKVVDPGSNGSTEVSFQFSEKLPQGIHHGVIEIVGEDALQHDNRRHFTIEVRKPWEVLVVHGDEVTPDNLTEAVIDEDGSSLFNCTVVDQDELPGSFSKFDAIIFLDPNIDIPETTWGILAEYVESGHGLGIFLGANAASGAFGHESFHGENAQKILTGRLDRQWRRPDESLFLSPDNLSHPIFKPFRNWETSVPWDDFPVFIHWGMVEDQNWNQFPTKTVLRFGNGKPAVIERQLGDGLVMVMTTPITEAAQIRGRSSWNTLFTGLPLPSWLLVRQITEHLVQSQNDRLNLNVGEVASLKNDFRIYPNEYRAFTPRTTATPEKVVAKESAIKYRFTSSPGHYRLRGTLAGPVLRGFSVNISAGQADLTRADPATLDAVLGAEKYQLATDQNQIQRQQGTTRRGQEFYPLLLLMLVIVLGVEYLLANRFYS